MNEPQIEVQLSDGRQVIVASEIRSEDGKLEEIYRPITIEGQADGEMLKTAVYRKTAQRGSVFIYSFKGIRR